MIAQLPRLPSVLVMMSVMLLASNPMVESASYTDQLVAAAKKEGKLIIYSTSTVEPGEKSLGQKMKDTFPWLDIEEVLMSSGSRLLERMHMEINAGKPPDIAHFGAGQMGELKEKGLLQTYRSPQEEMFPPEYIIQHRYYFPMSYRSVHPIYNTKLVKPDQLLKGYANLIEPQWKGQTGVDIGGTFWQFWTAMEIRNGEDRTREFMRRFGSNEARPFFSNSQIRNLVASGELTLGIYIYLNNIITMQKQGMPIGIWNADPVALSPSLAGILKTALHPNAAKLFAEWILGKEAQQWLTKQEVVIPVRRDVENPYPQYFKNVPFVVAGAEETDPRLPRLRADYEKFFRVKPEKGK